ncbi:hypothetical protein ACFXTI_041440 [Malus domestica]
MLEPQVLELQGDLKINDNLKKEIEELQWVCAGLLEENEQLKSEKAGFETSRPYSFLRKICSHLLLRLSLVK